MALSAAAAPVLESGPGSGVGVGLVGAGHGAECWRRAVCRTRPLPPASQITSANWPRLSCARQKAALRITWGWRAVPEAALAEASGRRRLSTSRRTRVGPDRRHSMRHRGPS